ncbi:MAG: preprotein translocase subunit SecE [Clostridiales bacterium]|nr:preprotein translocase subunit SecE [Clostridiales bacterium]
MEKNNNSKGEVKKQPKRKSKIAAFFKEAFSELKKVSWPTFKTVLKTTLVVLGVVAIFVVVLFAFDMLLGVGHDGLLLKDIDPLGKVIGAIVK